jgi:hypothetical protein
MTSTDSSDTITVQPHQNNAPSKVELTIHHQFSGIELVSPVYAGDIITCNLPPDQNVEVDSTIQTGFDIDYDQGKSIGVLMYKLQKHNIDKSNENTISDEEGTTCTHLVMIWRIYESGEAYVNSMLIEHDKSCVWDGDKLSKLAERYNRFNMRQNLVKYTWLMRDNAVLMTNVGVTCEEADYKIEMTLSEESINENTWRPLYIDVNR